MKCFLLRDLFELLAVTFRLLLFGLLLLFKFLMFAYFLLRLRLFFLFAKPCQELALKLLDFSHAFVVLFVVKACKCRCAFNARKVPSTSTPCFAVFVDLLLFQSGSARLTDEVDH